VDERTRLTSVAPLTADSIGNVTRVSTSSDAIPCASVIIVTVGAVKSGNTSTGKFSEMDIPATINRIAVKSTISLFCSEN